MRCCMSISSRPAMHEYGIAFSDCKQLIQNQSGTRLKMPYVSIAVKVNDRLHQPGFLRSIYNWLCFDSSIKLNDPKKTEILLNINGLAKRTGLKPDDIRSAIKRDGIDGLASCVQQKIESDASLTLKAIIDQPELFYETARERPQFLTRTLLRSDVGKKLVQSNQLEIFRLFKADQPQAFNEMYKQFVSNDVEATCENMEFLAMSPVETIPTLIKKSANEYWHYELPTLFNIVEKYAKLGELQKIPLTDKKEITTILTQLITRGAQNYLSAQSILQILNGSITVRQVSQQVDNSSVKCVIENEHQEKSRLRIGGVSIACVVGSDLKHPRDRSDRDILLKDTINHEVEHAYLRLNINSLAKRVDLDPHVVQKQIRTGLFGELAQQIKNQLFSHPKLMYLAMKDDPWSLYEMLSKEEKNKTIECLMDKDIGQRLVSEDHLEIFYLLKKDNIELFNEIAMKFAQANPQLVYDHEDLFAELPSNVILSTLRELVLERGVELSEKNLTRLLSIINIKMLSEEWTAAQDQDFYDILDKVYSSREDLSWLKVLVEDRHTKLGAKFIKMLTHKDETGREFLVRARNKGPSCLTQLFQDYPVISQRYEAHIATYGRESIKTVQELLPIIFDVEHKDIY